MICAESDPLPGGYIFLDVIGNGINGIVVAAKDPLTKEKVALKRFRRSKAALAPGLLEISNVIGLRHPHIVSCRDCGYDEAGEIFVAYDLIEGGDLRTWLNELKGSPLPLEAVRACAAQMLSALAFLRERNLIHGDLKPENILVREREPACFLLADLGGALRCPGASIRLRQPTGSPAYLAPERFYDSFSFNADLYSLGIILFELLTAERPFAGSVTDLARAHLAASPDFSKIPDTGLRSFIETLLEKNAKRRIRSATEALRIWQIYLDSGQCPPVEESPAPTSGSSASGSIWRDHSFSPLCEFAVRGHPWQVAFVPARESIFLALGFESHIEIWDAERGALLSAFLPGGGSEMHASRGGELFFPDSGGISRWTPGLRRAERVLEIRGGLRRMTVDQGGRNFAYLEYGSLVWHNPTGRVFHHPLRKQDSTAHIAFLPDGELALMEGCLPTTVSLFDSEGNVFQRYPLPGTILQVSPFGEALGTLIDWNDGQTLNFFHLGKEEVTRIPLKNASEPVHLVPGGCLLLRKDGILEGRSENGAVFLLGDAVAGADIRGLSADHRFLFQLNKRSNGTARIEVKQSHAEKNL
ncbi:MAG: serine/threonine-protein kinase [Opitutales bacterium]|nr:serine/threonine-protein kinase [Opitutales bacterium]